MARMAQQDQEKRIVHVKREDLITTLEANKQKHVAEYNEAMAGYKSELLVKLEEAVKKAKSDLTKQHAKLKAEFDQIDDSSIAERSDYELLVEGQSVHMKVPRSYAKEYDAAIDIAKWDVRETLELSFAEFNCFVRDQWDWKSDFHATVSMYNNRV